MSTQHHAPVELIGHENVRRQLAQVRAMEAIEALEEAHRNRVLCDFDRLFVLPWRHLPFGPTDRHDDFIHVKMSHKLNCT